MGVEGAGLVPWVGGFPDASFGFYLSEAFQSQTNTEKDIIEQESLGTAALICYRNCRTAITQDTTYIVLKALLNSN